MDGDLSDLASRLWGSAPPVEFSFPPDAGSCGLSISSQGGGVGPPPSKAVYPRHWWHMCCELKGTAA